MTLKVLLRATRDDAVAWAAGLAEALPEARIALWPDVPFAPDYVVAWKPPAELFTAIAAGPPPKAIFNLGAGVDALLALPNVPAVPVIRLEDAGMAPQMAQYAALAVLAAFRQRDAYRALQREARWQRLPQPEAADYPVGILGLGLLGQACARALAPFGFPLLGWSQNPKDVPGVRAFAGEAALAQVLGSAQVLICLLPLTPATRGLLDARRLGLLPRGAHLVNIARGEIVVDADLLALLDAGHLASATLDVFHEEPLPAGHRFWHHPLVRLTPHISAVTEVRPSAMQVAAKIRRLERGEPVTGVIDRRRGY